MPCTRVGFSVSKDAPYALLKLALREHGQRQWVWPPFRTGIVHAGQRGIIIRTQTGGHVKEGYGQSNI